ncbi:hypothetical protein WA158_004883 [Blastocystis sp. Blastoise]
MTDKFFLRVTSPEMSCFFDDLSLEAKRELSENSEDKNKPNSTRGSSFIPDTPSKPYAQESKNADYPLNDISRLPCNIALIYKTTQENMEINNQNSYLVKEDLKKCQKQIDIFNFYKSLLNSVEDIISPSVFHDFILFFNYLYYRTTTKSVPNRYIKVISKSSISNQIRSLFDKNIKKSSSSYKNNFNSNNNFNNNNNKNNIPDNNNNNIPDNNNNISTPQTIKPALNTNNIDLSSTPSYSITSIPLVDEPIDNENESFKVSLYSWEKAPFCTILPPVGNLEKKGTQIPSCLHVDRPYSYDSIKVNIVKTKEEDDKTFLELLLLQVVKHISILFIPFFESFIHSIQLNKNSNLYSNSDSNSNSNNQSILTDIAIETHGFLILVKQKDELYKSIQEQYTKLQNIYDVC